MPVSNAKAKLIYRVQLSEYIFELTFEMIDPKILDFKAGQYITIKIDESTRRQYSISSSPLKSKKVFTITFDKRPAGVGVNYLISLKKGDVITFIGEIGLFTLPNQLLKDLYFFSTGVGISPLKSMIETLILSGKYKNHNIYVVWGTRYKKWVIYESLFKSYQEKNYIKEYQIYLSKEFAKGYNHGRVTKYINEKTFDNNSQFFICGSRDLIESVENLLKEKGINSERMFYEKFY